LRKEPKFAKEKVKPPQQIVLGKLDIYMQKIKSMSQSVSYLAVV
jgi:hypothetical protein